MISLPQDAGWTRGAFLEHKSGHPLPDVLVILNLLCIVMTPDRQSLSEAGLRVITVLTYLWSNE